jgi:hypothetical protein
MKTEVTDIDQRTIEVAVPGDEVKEPKIPKRLKTKDVFVR